MHRFVYVFVILSPLAVTAGCGSSSRQPAQPPSAQPTTPTPSAPTRTSPTGPGALQAEANSAAAGDIPDNQVFLLFKNARAGYSIRYPEGWAQQGTGDDIVFRDKNNIVRIVVARGATPTRQSVARELGRMGGVRLVSPPTEISVAGHPATKVVYSTRSAPNAVTGKRVTLVVDRYYVSKGKRRAVVDLGTPEGVDNVDAYRLMIKSLRFR